MKTILLVIGYFTLTGLFLGTWFLIGYFIGSIPFGYILIKISGRGDIRQAGSGNIGATNVLRVGGKFLGALTLLLDALKGFISIEIVRIYWSNPHSHHLCWQISILTGFGAFIGHLYPVWLRFRGGKGVATMLGLYLAWAWPVGAVTCLTWLLIAIIFRYSSLAALIATIVAPLVTYFGLRNTHLAEVMSLITALIWWKHRANIQRLLRGTEPKIGRKSADAKSA